jgi:hypothetical protein
MNHFKIILVLSFWLTTDIVIGQKLSIEAKIDTNKISIGDQIGLSYRILKEKGLVMRYPALQHNITDKIEIVGNPVVDSSEIEGSGEQVLIKCVITSFDTGMYYIPPQSFLVKHGTTYDTVHSNATYLEVVGVPIDTTNTIRDIRGPENAPVSFAEILPYLLIILIVALIVSAIVYFYYKRKGKHIELRPAKPEEPPYITALRELDKIKSQKLWQQKQVKEYYTRITYVIRWYISKRFSILALEQTSEEILDHIKSLKLDKVNHQNLESLLNLADLVKFAKGEPDPNDNIIHLDNAYDFIKQTKIEVSEETIENKPIGNNIS